MDLLLFFHKGIVLGNSSQGQFIHEVDLVGVAHMFVLYRRSIVRANTRARHKASYLEGLHNQRKSSTEKHNLAILGVERQQLLNNWSKFRG